MFYTVSRFTGQCWSHCRQAIFAILIHIFGILTRVY